jgi:hypothetical protein
MALVKVISDNLFSGASLQKLEVGATVDVGDSTAERWVSAGLADLIDSKKEFEVATPEKAKRGK